MPAHSKTNMQSKASQAASPRSGRPNTPPDSPTAQLANPFEFAKQFLDALKVVQTHEAKKIAPVAGPQVEPNPQTSEPAARASKLEVKDVHEVWDSKAYQYKIVESPPTSELTEFDAYVFVVRTRIDRTSLKSIVYFDIKSEGLRDILRVLLKDIRWLSLGEDKPATEHNLLFHYLPELEAYRDKRTHSPVVDPQVVEALDLLIRTIKDRSRSTTERLIPILKEGKITYDLLWALFKANDHVISICAASGKPKCLRYDMGEEKKTDQGVEYFELQCQYLDFDGKVFGTVLAKLAIEKFRGARQINTLNAFPLKFHPTREKMRTRLAVRGQNFTKLVGSHHQYYIGYAFFQHKDGLVRKKVNSRIMVDAEQFRKCIPSYPRFYTKKSDSFFDLASLTSSTEQSDAARVKSDGLDLGELGEDDLLICSPTVMGFSLGDKFWGEYAVEDIHAIKWSDLPFASLTISNGKREVIMAITRNRLGQSGQDGKSLRTTNGFDDVVEGKGRGINMLLHGTPGVGKTFTAEALSEHFHRPLYSISAGDLSSDASELEDQLNRIFETASAWNALLLLDEADVFLQQRSLLTLERNRLVAVFLRKLEFFDGVLFLTTNLINDFDAAILNRIHLKMKYEDLDRNARKTIITQFLKTINEGGGPSNICMEYLDRFARVSLNGREIRNTIATANDLADGKGEQMSSSHITQALVANGYVVPKSGDISVDDSLYE